jgi:tRNA threonylcarbamoyladenosine biosynthesis protein TsaB
VSAAKTILALDTATRQATVAVCRGSRILAERGREVTTHSEGLLELIDETLQQAGVTVHDLDAIACGRGPGSFTGLRIGMATVKGLCLATGAPLIAISSLLPLAAAAAEAIGELESPVAAVLDARREEVFVGLYRGLELIGPERVLRPEDLPAALPDDKPTVLAGDGALLYWDRLSGLLGDRASLAPEGCHAIQARYLCLAALPRLAAAGLDDLEATVPLYIRPSDARLPERGWGLGRRGRHGRPAASAVEERQRAPDAEEAGQAVDPGLIERLRQSGLRLDREGRWRHGGSVIEHPRIARMLHLWLDRLDDGRYVVRFDERDESLYAYVEVEDAPFVVRTVELDKGPAGHVEVHLRLSDESVEELDYASLGVGADNALYCRVKEGRFDARFSRQAYYLIGELVEEDPLSGGFALRAVGRLWAIQSAPRRDENDVDLSG